SCGREPSRSSILPSGWPRPSVSFRSFYISKRKLYWLEHASDPIFPSPLCLPVKFLTGLPDVGRQGRRVSRPTRAVGPRDRPLHDIFERPQDLFHGMAPSVTDVEEFVATARAALGHKAFCSEDVCPDHVFQVDVIPDGRAVGRRKVVPVDRK